MDLYFINQLDCYMKSPLPSRLKISPLFKYAVCLEREVPISKDNDILKTLN